MSRHKDRSQAPDDSPGFEAVVDELRAFRLGAPYPPTSLSTNVARVLFGPAAGLAKWSVVAKALSDQGQALALFARLFPEERWALTKGRLRHQDPEFAFAAYAPLRPGDEPTTDLPPEIARGEHDVCAIAVVLAALDLKRETR